LSIIILEGSEIMEPQQFEELCIKIDRIFAILAVQNIEDKNEKVYILKKLYLLRHRLSAPAKKVL